MQREQRPRAGRGTYLGESPAHLRPPARTTDRVRAASGLVETATSSRVQEAGSWALPRDVKRGPRGDVCRRVGGSCAADGSKPPATLMGSQRRCSCRAPMLLPARLRAALGLSCSCLHSSSAQACVRVGGPRVVREPHLSVPVAARPRAALSSATP